MKKFVCSVCGYVHLGNEPPVTCIQCGVSHDKFREITDLEELAGASGPFLWENNHQVGVARNMEGELVQSLRAAFMAAGAGTGIYAAIARQADREGFPEISEACRRISREKAEHAGRFAELLGEVLTADTMANLKTRIEMEYKSSKMGKELAGRTGKSGHDTVRDTMNEICKDDSRHGQILEGLLRRYF